MVARRQTMNLINRHEKDIHQGLKNRLCHHLSPFHLLSFVIVAAYKTKRHRLRCLLLSIVKGYDLVYKSVLVK